ncbi:MAG: thiamine-phosphate kinase [Gemmatimonadetes bacterium]|nr:thiamine-phosphate kinase [Gemmatimonadota bacterium]
MADEKSRVAWLVNALPSIVSGGVHAVQGCDYSIRLDARDSDDCAVVSIDGVGDLVVGTDYIRGPKFLLYEKGFLGNADIGRFLVTANISDIAAMGAAPIGILVVVRYPSEMGLEQFRDVMAGIDDGCRAYNARLLGGDTGSAERLILSGTAIGLTTAGKALSRSTAEPGDVVIVTGLIGGAGAAIQAGRVELVRDLTSAVWESLLDCWRRPVAQPRLGRWLSDAGFRVTCQDVSDGLRATAREIGELNSLAVVLQGEALPLHPGVEPVARLMNVDPVGLGLSASTDFVLVVTCAAHHADAILEGVSACGYEGRAVGHLEPGSGVWLQHEDGLRVPAPGVEWRNQVGEVTEDMLRGLQEET